MACDLIAAPAGRRENQRGESLISFPFFSSLVHRMHMYSDGGNEGEWIHMAFFWLSEEQRVSVKMPLFLSGATWDIANLSLW